MVDWFGGEVSLVWGEGMQMVAGQGKEAEEDKTVMPHLLNHQDVNQMVVIFFFFPKEK